MPRRKVEAPTFIYWLIDTRTGNPFYCGKTIHKPAYRLSAHFNTAARRPDRVLSRRLCELGDFAAIQVVHVVPIGGDWVNAEREGIAYLRSLFPDCLNVTRGGEGAPGNIHSLEWREAQSQRMRDRIVSPSTRAKMAERMRVVKPRKGKTLSPEARAALSASRRGRKHKPHSEETKARISAAQKGRPLAPEHVAKLREGHRHRLPPSEETKARISAKHKGRVFSSEHRLKLREAWNRRKRLTVAANGASDPASNNC